MSSCQWPVQLVLLAQEQDARCFLIPFFSGVGALECATRKVHVVVGITNGHTREHRAGEVRAFFPLDDERRAGRNRSWCIDEVQRQRSTVELGFIAIEHHSLYAIAV